MPNWAKLYNEGRCFAIGIPWNKEQHHAAHVLGIPAEYVRRGCLSQEDYEAMKADDEKHLKKTGELPVEAMDRNQLLAKASELGVEYTPAVSNEALIQLIQSAKPKKAASEKKLGGMKKTAAEPKSKKK